MTLLAILLAPLVAATCAAASYLLFLGLVSLLPRRRRGAAAAHELRLAVIVPAHNEETLLPHLLAGLAGQQYSPSSFRVHVLADNCSDSTAEVAAAYGATVHRRSAPENPGKGQAIAWLLPDMLSWQVNGFVFLDADSEVEPGFLAAVNAKLQEGHEVVQASYRVSHADSAPLLSLRALAFALVHELRGRAKARLGWSCGIWGNGVAMRREAIAGVGWQSFSSVEDAEQHLRLVLAGYRVGFLPEVSVYGDMPRTLAGASAQQRRWEAGRMAILRRYGRRLFAFTLRKRSLDALAVLVELALPPFSVLGVLALTLTLATLVSGIVVLQLLSCAALAALALYVLLGMLYARLKPASYGALLLFAPRYVVWKLGVYLREMIRRTDSDWVRTARDASTN